MINAKGETIYTNAEIGYELGLNPATINACAKRLFGRTKIPYWNLNEVKLICEYIKSITVEEDAKRLAILHNTIVEILGNEILFDDGDTRKRIDRDVHLQEAE